MSKENNSEIFTRFSKDNFHSLCDKVAEKDAALQLILDTHGYPPMWTRSNSFATLILIILEQQVSLASARAAFNKLKTKIGRITPQKLLQLSDEELRACYFSRQKTLYARHLAEAIISKKIQLQRHINRHDDEIRTDLTRLKGIGNWTTDVYLLFALQRTDIFPVGDLAMINALKEVKRLPATVSREKIIQIAERWRPNRSIASMILWHHYIKTRNIKL